MYSPQDALDSLGKTRLNSVRSTCSWLSNGNGPCEGGDRVYEVCARASLAFDFKMFQQSGLVFHMPVVLCQLHTSWVGDEVWISSCFIGAVLISFTSASLLSVVTVRRHNPSKQTRVVVHRSLSASVIARCSGALQASLWRTCAACDLPHVCPDSRCPVVGSLTRVWKVPCSETFDMSLERSCFRRWRQQARLKKRAVPHPRCSCQ